MIKSNELEIDFSTLYYFLPSVNDRSEEINQYLTNVTISCVDIEKEEFDKWTSQEFDPSQLDLYGNQNKIMTDCLVEDLRISVEFPIQTLSEMETIFCQDMKKEYQSTRLVKARAGFPRRI